MLHQPVDPAAPGRRTDAPAARSRVAAPARTSAAAEDLPTRLRPVIRRGLQLGIDLLLLSAACLVPVGTLRLAPHDPDGTLGSLLLTIPWVMAILLACTALSAAYWTWLPLRLNGQTPGMRVLGLRVVRTDGSPAIWSQLAVRWLLLLVDGMLFGLVGALSILLSRDDQRLGDQFAETLVVEAPRLVHAEPTTEER